MEMHLTRNSHDRRNARACDSRNTQDRDCWALFIFDNGALPKNSEQCKRGLHVFHRTVTKSQHVKGKVSMIGIVRNCRHSMLESS